MRLFFSTFLLVFLAELGDKSQIAGFTFASKGISFINVVVGSTLALSFSTLLAVFLGEKIAKNLPRSLIKTLSGLSFILIGIIYFLKNSAFF